MHKIIDNLNPERRVTKNREFFEMTPEAAYEMLEAIAVISGSQNKLKKVAVSKDNSNSQQLVRRPPIDFYKCGLKDGDELVCIEDTSVIAIVRGAHKVLYDNELTSLSAIMKKIKGTQSIAGPSFFTYQGELLTELAKRTQWKQ